MSENNEMKKKQYEEAKNDEIILQNKIKELEDYKKTTEIAIINYNAVETYLKQVIQETSIFSSECDQKITYLTSQINNVKAKGGDSKLLKEYETQLQNEQELKAKSKPLTEKVELNEEQKNLLKVYEIQAKINFESRNSLGANKNAKSSEKDGLFKKAKNFITGNGA